MGTTVNPKLIRGREFQLGGSTFGFGEGGAQITLHGSDAATNDANLEVKGNVTVRANLQVLGTTTFQQVTVQEAQNASFQGDTTIGDAATPGLLTVFSTTLARGGNWDWKSGPLVTDPIKMAFVASTGALTVEGLITANGGLSVPAGKTLSVAGSTNTQAIACTALTASGLITANAGMKLGNGQKLIANDALAEIGESTQRIKRIFVDILDASSLAGSPAITGTTNLTFTVNSGAGAGNPALVLKAAGEVVDPQLFFDTGVGVKSFKVNKPFDFQGNNVTGTGTFTAGQLVSNGSISALANLIINGNTTLGDSALDLLTVNAKVDTSLIPSGVTKHLGSSADRWGTLFGTTVDITGAATVGSLSAGSGSITTTGTLSTGPILASGLIAGATATTEPSLFYSGATFFDGAQSGQAPTSLNRIADALDFASPAMRNWIRLDPVAHATGNPNEFFIDFHAVNSPVGFNVGSSFENKPLIDVFKDGLTLFQGTDTVLDDFDIVSSSPLLEPNRRNAIKFHNAIPANVKIWYRYHRKSKAT